MDPNNPVVKLCLEGLRAEGEGRNQDAHAHFLAAWEASIDDYDACIAAHYLARQQASPSETLHWNEEALRRADAVGDERVREFYPSLLLNVGHSFEVAGDLSEARRFYQAAMKRLDEMPAGLYGEHVRASLEEKLERVSR